jgi:hypothetical protein
VLLVIVYCTGAPLLASLQADGDALELRYADDARLKPSVGRFRPGVLASKFDLHESCVVKGTERIHQGFTKTAFTLFRRIHI